MLRLFIVNFAHWVLQMSQQIAQLTVIPRLRTMEGTGRTDRYA